MRIIFAGSGEFGLPTLRALLDAGHDLVQVVSQPDRPAGRGRKLTPTPIAQLALDKQLPLIRTQKIADEILPPADAMIVIAFGQKIPESIVHHPRLGSINLHASRLPRYRGAAPINWAILSGETTAGNSIIRLAPRMDAGAVLAQSELQIGQAETAGELHDRLSLDGVHLVLDVLQQLSDGRAVEREQDDSQATLAPKLSRESALIDWKASAEEIARKIRGLSPWPGCRVKLLDTTGQEKGRATLVRARPVGNGLSRWECGEITTYGPVAAGDGNGVEILEIQPEGKRPMPLVEYRNGHPWQAGMRLESIA